MSTVKKGDITFWYESGTYYMGEVSDIVGHDVFFEKGSILWSLAGVDIYSKNSWRFLEGVIIAEHSECTPIGEILTRIYNNSKTI